MASDFETSKPIYIQIAESIFQQIVREEIKPGDKLPSVREMAVKSGVNPNTIQRTYGEMERMGIVETKRGQGTFIVDKEEIVHELKHSMQQEIIQNFVRNMNELGLSKDQIIVGIENYFKQVGE